MTGKERIGTPDLEAPGLGAYELGLDDYELGLEDYEFVTMAGHTYTCVRLDEDGWKREGGFLERRQRQVPVSVERRSQDGAR